MPSLFKNNDFLIKVVGKNRFFRAPFGRVNKNIEWFLVGPRKKEKYLHFLYKEIKLLATGQKSSFTEKKFLRKFDFSDSKVPKIERKPCKIAFLDLKSTRNIAKLPKNAREHVFSTPRDQKPRLSQNFRNPTRWGAHLWF